MLTGVIKPTYGTAFVNGCNILTEFARVKEHLGFCPQHDVLIEQ